VRVRVAALAPRRRLGRRRELLRLDAAEFARGERAVVVDRDRTSPLISPVAGSNSVTSTLTLPLMMRSSSPKTSLPLPSRPVPPTNRPARIGAA
jgi:hypothetical protein